MDTKRKRRYPLSLSRQSRRVTVTLLSLWPIGCLPSSPLRSSNPQPTGALKTADSTRPDATATSTTTAKESVPPDAVAYVTAASRAMDTRDAIAPGWQELPVDGFEAAMVYYRPGAPKWVITHGAGGHAEWHCAHYQRILGESTTLICPRGKRRYASDPTHGYYYPDHLALAKEVTKALSTFEGKFEPRSPQEKYVYSGYSQGATMGILALAPLGDRFSYLVLVEGGYADASMALARQFRVTGGHGVLYICGTRSCHEKSQTAVHFFKQVGLAGESHWAKGAGHRPDGPVSKALVTALPVVLATDPRWKNVTLQVPTDALGGNG